LLVTVHSWEKLLPYAETLGPIAWPKRPFEMMVFPYGYHFLIRPREREASLTATVDWMNFWLQGRENPEKRQQNQRWRKIKSDWDQVRTEEAKGRKSPERPNHGPHPQSTTAVGDSTSRRRPLNIFFRGMKALAAL